MTSATALLLIDPYNDFISEGGKVWPLIRETANRLGLVRNLKRLLEAARESGMFVVFVPHHRHVEGDFDGWVNLNPTHLRARDVKPFAPGTWGGEFHPDLRPIAGEAVASEHWFQNGFLHTDLDLRLRRRGITRVLVSGVRANTCFEATARHASELGYHVTLVRDATAGADDRDLEATFEVNAPTYAHAVTTTDLAIAALRAAPQQRAS